MALTVQLWSPDTCGCVFHQVFDDAEPLETRQVRFVTREEAEAIVADRRAKGDKVTREPQPEAKLCQAHAALGHSLARHTAVTEENVRKNRAIAEVAAATGIPVEDIQWQDPKTGKPNWDADRNLVLTVPATVPVAALQGAMNAKFGAGKIQLLQRVSPIG